MKTILKTAIILLTIVISGCIIYCVYQFGIPFLEAKSEYTKNIPTIEKLQLEISSKSKSIDSLTSKNAEYKLRIEMLEHVVSEQKNSKTLQQQISSQLKSVQDKLQKSEYESNGRK